MEVLTKKKLKVYTNELIEKIEYTKHTKKAEAKIKNIIIFGVDALGGYALRKDNKIFNQILKDSSYSFLTRNTFPTATSINWTTIFTGSSPSQHGYLRWDSAFPDIPSALINEYKRYPTIFYLIKKQIPGSKIGSFFPFENFKNLHEIEVMDKVYVAPDVEERGSKHDLNYTHDDALRNAVIKDKEVLDEAIEFIIKEKPVFTFIHQEAVDRTGHEKGHDTKYYYDAIKVVEKGLYRLKESLEKANMLDETLIIICADHGGFDYGHNSTDVCSNRYIKKSQLIVEVPLIFYNKHLKNKGKLNRQLFNWDIAPTIARILGVDVPRIWIGKDITEIEFK